MVFICFGLRLISFQTDFVNVWPGLHLWLFLFIFVFINVCFHLWLFLFSCFCLVVFFMFDFVYIGFCLQLFRFTIVNLCLFCLHLFLFTFVFDCFFFLSMFVLVYVCFCQRLFLFTFVFVKFYPLATQSRVCYRPGKAPLLSFFSLSATLLSPPTPLLFWMDESNAPRPAAPTGPPPALAGPLWGGRRRGVRIKKCMNEWENAGNERWMKEWMNEWMK